MNRTELIMRRRNVRAFIEADPIDLVLTRQAEPEKTAAGGYVQGMVPDPLESQLARVIQNKRRFNNGIVNAEAGEIPHTDYLLLGMHTLDVEEEDWFMWQDRKYKVTGIHKLRTESTLCSIDLLGEVNRA